MSNWLFEGGTVVYLVLGVLALILISVWWSNRRRQDVIALGVVFGLIALAVVLDLLVATDREQIVSHVRDMAAAVADKDVDRILSHVSEDFRLDSNNKEGFRGVVRRHLPEVDELIVWDLEPRDVSRADRKGQITFRVKGRGNHYGLRDETVYRCRATFGLDQDDQWRMTGFQVFDFLTDPDKGTPLALPF